MPELPDVELYRSRLAARVIGARLTGASVASPFLIRSVRPPLESAFGRRVTDVARLGKRLVLSFEGARPDARALGGAPCDGTALEGPVPEGPALEGPALDGSAVDGSLHLVIHLMIAGRLQWKALGARSRARSALAHLDFEPGTLVLTEAGTRRRASLHVVAGRAALAEHDPGGLEVLGCDLDELRQALTRERHTLKRALTDPRILSGIGNAYSDEILHAAELSPFRLTTDLAEAEMARLHEAARATLTAWCARLERETGDGFPSKVTAFRPGMAVHGRYGEPCPRCATPVQRIVHAEHEANYCPRCQTGGRLLRDRALSKLLHDDWPRTIDELERRGRRGTDPPRGER